MATEGTKWEYIGDGVFVRFNGIHVILHASDVVNDSADMIYLSTDVLDSLLSFLDREKVSAHEALVEEEVRRAIDLERRFTQDRIAELEKSAKNCPSCGLLFPDHGERCGLWVRRAERNGGQK